MAAHCLACHGPDESTREADLRLDRFENATAESESGEKPIVVGNPAISEMIRRVSLPVGHDERMPPEGQGLSKAEILAIPIRPVRIATPSTARADVTMMVTGTISQIMLPRNPLNPNQNK